MIVILVLLSFGGILAMSLFIHRTKASNKNLELIQKLKKEGDLIEIDLTTIHIKHNSSKKEIMVDMFGSKINPDNRRTDRYYEFKKVINNRSELKIPVIYRGKNMSFVTVLHTDGHWLGIKFHIQKKTTLYIDKNDIENSYIDFTFLDIPEIDFKAVHSPDFR